MASREWELSCGMKCIKYTLIVVNTIFVLVAIPLLINGKIYGCLGLNVMAVGCLGIFAAVQESTWCLNAYGITLSVHFIWEVLQTLEIWRSKKNVFSTADAITCAAIGIFQLLILLGTSLLAKTIYFKKKATYSTASKV